MKKLMVSLVVASATLSGCGISEPPSCNNNEVLLLVEQLVKENAGAVFDVYVPSNDPVMLFKFMGLGIGMSGSGNFYIPKQQAEKITWGFSNTRTTALDQPARSRYCAASVSYGNEKEAVGNFTLSYTISFNDDGEVIVSL